VPNYDVTCTACEADELDVLLPSWQTPVPPCPVCLGPREKVWRAKANAVIGDECDVWVKHAICNDDGTPKRYRSKQAMKEAAAAKGMVNHVEHIAGPGSDKNKHTQRWI